jgi:hypothetical protein
LDIADL